MSTLESAIKSKFKNEQQKAILNIIYTGNWLIHSHNVFLKPFKISPQQYNILRILRGSKTKMAMNDIKCRMLDKTPNITRLSDKLESKGLVNRVRSKDDRRVIYLEISGQGIDYLNEIDTAWDHTELPEKKLTLEEARLLNQFLDQLRS